MAKKTLQFQTASKHFNKSLRLDFGAKGKITGIT